MIIYSISYSNIYMMLRLGKRYADLYDIGEEYDPENEAGIVSVVVNYI